MTIRETINNGTASLKAAGIETAGIDTSLLLAHTLGISRTSLVAKRTEPLSENAFTVFNGLIKRRLNGECIAYITGKKEFFYLDFTVNKNVLVPRPDTEILVEAALKKIKNNDLPLRILDLCTGCGAIAISIKHKMPNVEVFASDISKEAIVIAKINTRQILTEEGKINFYRGNLYKALPKPHPLFSLIISNPPYIPSKEIETLPIEVQNEPHLALDGGRSGLKIINQIIKKCPLFLEKGGALLLEADPSQMKDISFMLEKKGVNNIELYKDLSGQERVIGGIFDNKN